MSERGTPIPGSSLFRNFCSDCGTAIRVIQEHRNDKDQACSECLGLRWRLDTIMHKGQVTPASWTGPDLSFDRAARYQEDGRS